MKHFPFDVENLHEILIHNKNFLKKWPVKDEEIKIFFNNVLRIYLKKINELNDKDRIIIFSSLTGHFFKKFLL